MAFKTLGSADSEAESPIVSEINIAPLTDVFLVLLIIFMVTSSALNSMGVSVDLPQVSQETASSQPEGVIVTLLPGGGVRVQKQEFSPGKLENLQRVLKAAFLQTSSKLVILEGDRQAFLGSAIEVMDHARKAGAEKFAIATTSETSH